MPAGKKKGGGKRQKTLCGEGTRGWHIRPAWGEKETLQKLTLRGRKGKKENKQIFTGRCWGKRSFQPWQPGKEKGRGRKTNSFFEKGGGGPSTRQSAGITKGRSPNAYREGEEAHCFLSLREKGGPQRREDNKKQIRIHMRGAPRREKGNSKTFC